MRAMGILPSVSGRIQSSGSDMLATIEAGRLAAGGDEGIVLEAGDAAPGVAGVVSSGVLAVPVVHESPAGAGHHHRWTVPVADDLDGGWPCEAIVPRPVGLAPPLSEACSLHSLGGASRLNASSSPPTVFIATMVTVEPTGSSVEAMLGLSVATQRLADWRQQRRDETAEALRSLEAIRVRGGEGEGKDNEQSDGALHGTAHNSIALAVTKRIERQRKRLARFGRRLQKQVGKLQAQDLAERERVAKEQRRHGDGNGRGRSGRRGSVARGSGAGEGKREDADVDAEAENVPFETKVQMEVEAGRVDGGGGASLGDLLGLNETDTREQAMRKA